MPTAGCCAHDHDCNAEDCSSSWSLYKHIDIQRVRNTAICLCVHKTAVVGQRLHSYLPCMWRSTSCWEPLGCRCGV